MKTFTNIPQQIEEVLEKGRVTTSRRDLLKSAGLLVVSFSATGARPLIPAASAQAPAAAAGPYTDPDFRQLDSWIVIHEDNSATFYVGKTDLGQGTGTAFRQIMSDELDIAYDKTSVIMGRTDVTVDQGGSGGSDAIQRDGWPMRRVAAEARRVLLELASTQFVVPVDQLAVSEGVVTVKAEPSRKATYGELIGSKRFNVTLTGDNINAATGAAKVKAVQDLKIVGQSLQRYDIPPKVDGSLKWAVDVKLPGMLHARNVKPPVAGAKLMSIDESSVRDMPGFVKVVSKGNYVAVVCEREEQAIRAARRLKVNWQKPATPSFPASEDLYRYMRGATPTSGPNENVVGNPGAALASAEKVVEAEYDFPFQGHTAIGPAHATADPSNGQMTIYSNDMKAYGLRRGVAEFLQMPPDRVHVIWMEGPQGYGRTAADDAGFEAAFLAKELGRPVRMQWMRDEETAWDTKGPAYAFKLRGGLDAQSNLTALEYNATAADYNHVGYNEPDTVLIAQLAGMGRSTPSSGRSSTPSDKYVIPSRRTSTRVVSLPLVFETPLRTGNLRDPDGPQVTFASESFLDELAAEAKADPGRVPPEAPHRQHRGRRRVQAGTLHRRGQGGGGGLWLGDPSFTQAARRRIHPHRARHRVRLPQPNRRRSDRRGRGRSRNRSRLGEAARLRARLRAGHQPRGAAPHRRRSHAPLAEPRAPRGSQIQHRNGHERGLELLSHPHPRRHAGPDRRRAGERRSQAGPARSPSLWSGRDGVQTHDRSGRQRNLRCDRCSYPPGSIPGRARARRTQGCTRVTRRTLTAPSCLATSWRMR